MGLVMYAIVKRFFQALVGEKYREKHLSAATGGASNMSGKYQGAVTHLDRISPSLFSTYGVVRSNWTSSINR